jgi:Cullin family
MGLIQFRVYIFADPSLKTKILQGACDLIEVDRKDASLGFDSDLLKKAIALFHDLGVYASEFEPRFLNHSEAFFASWAEKEAADQYLATYAENSHLLIEREIKRCELYTLNRSTRQKLCSLLDENLVTKREEILLRQSDVLGLMRTANKAALEYLYSLLERKNLGSKLKSTFNSYIIEQGTAIVFDEDKESEMVVRLLDFKKQLDDTWKDSFHKDEELGHTLREAFETFMNKGRKSESSWGTDNPKTGEMIAKYVDMLLKGGLKVLGRKEEDTMAADEDTEINQQLDKVLDLFRFVHGKAVFEAFYKNDLARRLLMGRSANDDSEKSMLARLKTGEPQPSPKNRFAAVLTSTTECGSSFTHNLESMFKDMDLARDEMASYNALQRERREKPPLDLNVNVLSSAAWPTYPDTPVRVPVGITKALSEFEKFYNNKYNGRKLSWKHQLAHCQLRARFPRGDKEIVVSSFQAIVLLLFNDVPSGGTLRYDQIQEVTGLCM